MKRPELKVLVNYMRQGVSISQSLYTGPTKTHADRAYVTATILMRHGMLAGTLQYFDGVRLRPDWEKSLDRSSATYRDIQPSCSNCGRKDTLPGHSLCIQCTADRDRLQDYDPSQIGLTIAAAPPDYNHCAVCGRACQYRLCKACKDSENEDEEQALARRIA